MLPSLCTAVAGGPVRGSWWSHAAAHRIFDAYGALAEHPDVACAKLIGGKVTLVHRRLWLPLVTVGQAREPWQTRRLPSAARRLLARVDAEVRVLAAGSPAKTLERRLLVASQQVHTATGDHALELSTWTCFARKRGLRLARQSAAESRAQLEAAASALGAAHGTSPRLPWE